VLLHQPDWLLSISERDEGFAWGIAGVKRINGRETCKVVFVIEKL
jgi:hypothetical protein